jgi:hypothetical protein
MGPEFPLQRMLAQSVGMIEDPVRSSEADCESRSPRDPNFEQPETRLIPLISDDEFVFGCSQDF